MNRGIIINKIKQINAEVTLLCAVVSFNIFIS